MRTDILDALMRKYEGETLIAQSNIRTYIENPTGIGEHPDIVEAVHDQVCKLADANEHLGIVRALKASLSPPQEESGAPKADV